jgi:hypothetical protein
METSPWDTDVVAARWLRHRCVCCLRVIGLLIFKGHAGRISFLLLLPSTRVYKGSPSRSPLLIYRKPENMADEFNWSRPGLNESQLHALTILTNIYYNPVTPNNPEPELEDLPEPEDPDEYHPDELKRYFLDRLAEIWSRRPNGDFVSAAVLQETKAGVTVWLCRNQDEHCNVEDNEFRSSIEKFMRAAAQRGGSHQSLLNIDATKLTIARLP